MNKNIKDLVLGWEKAAITMMTTKEFSIKQIENLLRETYKVCTEYKNKDMVPKELCKVFVHIERFLSYGADAYYIDECTTPSDSAEYDAIAFILEEIEYGFYNEEYKCAFPIISVDNNQCKSYVLNLEEDFLEYFIEENR